MMITILLLAITSCQAIGDIIDYSHNDVRNAILLPMGAGLSTVVGALAIFFVNMEEIQMGRSKFLAGSLSFAAAVMIYVSFVALWPEAKEQFESGGTDDELLVHLYTGLSFFGGVLMGWAFKVGVYICQDYRENLENSSGSALAIEMQSDIKKDKIGQEIENRSEEPSVIAMGDEERKAKIMRAGIITVVSIALHNFPEGLVAFLAAVADWEVGVVTAFAIAVHNIPEGISIAVPYYYATESRWMPIFIALLAGLAELLGALIGWAILDDIWGREAFGILFALTAGIMVFISIAELMPLARSNDPDDKVTTLCFFLGMLTIEVSLVIEKH